MVQYVLQKTLVTHSDSINALAFTHDGSLFASGADDGVIAVFKGNGHGEEVRRFQMKAPVTTLLWHSRFGYTVIAGDACGDVHTICLNNSMDVSVSFLCPQTSRRDFIHRGTSTTILLIASRVLFTALCKVVHC
jgi:WD40 repeat protein